MTTSMTDPSLLYPAVWTIVGLAVAAWIGWKVIKWKLRQKYG